MTSWACWPNGAIPRSSPRGGAGPDYTQPLIGIIRREAGNKERWREVETNYDSKYAALYYPWLTVDGPDGQPIEVPPCGHIAGIYARSDNERGVHKAPANEVIRGALSAESQITERDVNRSTPPHSTSDHYYALRAIVVLHCTHHD